LYLNVRAEEANFLMSSLNLTNKLKEISGRQGVDTTVKFIGFYGNGNLPDVDLSGLTGQDVSDKQDGSILAYYDEDNASIYIVSDNEIYANADSSKMFYNFTALETVDVKDLNTTYATSFTQMFYPCKSLKEIDLSTWDFSNVTSTEGMFEDCESLTSITFPADLDTSNVSNMERMFANCKSLTAIDLSNFSLENVTSLSFMFSGCYKLQEIDLSNKSAPNLTYEEKSNGTAHGTYLLFPKYSANLKKVNLSNTSFSNITDLSYLFAGLNNVTEINLSGFSADNVENIYGMFMGCESVSELDLSSLNTSKVTNMAWLFGGCDNLSSINFGDNFITSNVTNMQQMFYYCYSLSELDLSCFDTSNVTNMYRMFYACSGLSELDLSSFDTAKVTNVKQMLSYCNNLADLDISSFDMSNVSNASELGLSTDTNLYVVKTPKTLSEELALPYTMYDREDNNKDFDVLPTDKSRTIYKTPADGKVSITITFNDEYELIPGTMVKIVDKENNVVVKEFEYDGPTTFYLELGNYTALVTAPEGYSIDSDSANFSLALDYSESETYYYVTNSSTGSYLTCLNKTRATDIDEYYWNEEKRDSYYKDTDNINDLTFDNATLDADELEEKIKAILYNAYFSEMNVLESSGYSVNKVEKLVQRAVWYYTDDYEDENYDYNSGYLYMLINSDNSEVPEDFEITYAKSIDDQYQNFAICPSAAELYSVTYGGKVNEANLYFNMSKIENYNLSLTKKKGDKYLEDDEFAFALSLSGLEANTTYTIEDSDLLLNSDNEGNASIEIVLGFEETITILDLPNNTTYQISELASSYEGSYLIDTYNVDAYIKASRGSGEAGNDIATESESINVETGDTSITFTNNLITTEVSGNKTWNDNDDQDGKRPSSITVNLYKNDELYQSKEVSEEDEWSYSFTDLPKYEGSSEIVYKIVEEVLAYYESEIDGYNLINSYNPELVCISVDKSWEDDDDNDGIRASEIEVILYADGIEVETIKLSEENNWHYEFINLAKYDEGEEITYSFSEKEVAGYISSISGSVEEGFKIINTHEKEKVNISGSKSWQGNDANRPKKIAVQLLKNGEEVKYKIAVLSEENNWSFEFNDLDKYSDGEEIGYSIVEVEIPENYSVSYQEAVIDEDSIILDLVNIYEEPDKPKTEKPTTPREVPNTNAG